MLVVACAAPGRKVQKTLVPVEEEEPDELVPQLPLDALAMIFSQPVIFSSHTKRSSTNYAG